jgi:uncharacterized repeat protein (TIGR03803 family)
LAEAGNGVLYGTAGGAKAGVIFRITSAGAESVVYRFQGGVDGDTPSGQIVVANGVLYGTTVFGGNIGTCFQLLGCGTVYAFDLGTSQHTVLYRFTGGRGGAYPSGVTHYRGALYGTTQSGGKGWACGTDCGSVFRVSTSGSGGEIYGFRGAKDFGAPLAALFPMSGTLYGTASMDGCGAHRCGGGVFSVTTAGDERVLYAFPKKTYSVDGLYPSSTARCDRRHAVRYVDVRWIREEAAVRLWNRF